MKNLMFLRKLIGLWLLFMMTVTWAADVPVVELQTNMGKIVLELNPQQAPKTVENFLSYAKSGFYEGTIFHRVISNFMVQGGGYTQDFTKKPTRPPIPNEANNGLKNRRGSVAMARTGDPDSANSQFFINMADNHFLDYQAPTASGWGYAVFGQVIRGMEVLNEIQAVKTGAQGPFSKEVPEKAVIIQKVTMSHAKPTVSVDTVSPVVPPETEKTPPAAKTEEQETTPIKEVSPENVRAKDSTEGQDKVKATVKETSPEPVPMEEPTESKPTVAKSVTDSNVAEKVTVKDSTEGQNKVAVPAKETSPEPLPVEPTESKPTVAKSVDEKSPDDATDTASSKGKEAVMAPDKPSQPDTPELPPS